MSLEENKELVRRIYGELWNERKLEVAEELIAQDAVNYDTGLLPQPFGPEELKGTVRMVTAGFASNTCTQLSTFAGSLCERSL
jgi:SnoaL-like polyketide cyclase